jgi:hypothetical protein
MRKPPQAIRAATAAKTSVPQVKTRTMARWLSPLCRGWSVVYGAASTAPPRPWNSKAVLNSSTYSPYSLFSSSRTNSIEISKLMPLSQAWSTIEAHTLAALRQSMAMQGLTG